VYSFALSESELESSVLIDYSSLSVIVSVTRFRDEETDLEKLEHMSYEGETRERLEDEVCACVDGESRE
jgi:hypothetical protein